MKEYSPFQPGVPVKPGMFVGREKQIDEIDRYLRQVVSGRQQSVFLIGDRGLGKTSLASFVLHYAEKQHNLIGIHTFLGGVSSLDEVVQKVFEELLIRTDKESWSKKVRKFFGTNVEEVGLFGINLKFNPPKSQLEALRKDFPRALSTFVESIKAEKNGLLIILDDINGTLDNEGFANWFKSMADRVAVSYDRFPVFFLLIGLPEKRDQLFAQQPSLSRIFQIMEIEKLKDSEVDTFYGQAFEDANMKVEPDAVRVMIDYASGYPVLMQEIGDAVFWADADKVVDLDDAERGVVEASERIGKKYLDHTFYNAVRSPRYRSIIRKIGQKLKYEFTKAEIQADLTDEEAKVFTNFLTKIKGLGIISQANELPRGHYRFVNRLYPLYLFMESLSAKY